MVDARFARRQAVLSCAVVRNIAFYRAGWVNGDGHGHLKDDSEMGRTINGNFIDMAVLEWSKLFVDWEAKHHWRRFVQGTDARAVFRTTLLAALGLEVAGWEQYHAGLKIYRDRFVAHLRVHLEVPILRAPFIKKSVCCLIQENARVAVLRVNAD